MTLLIFVQCNTPHCPTIVGLEGRTQADARAEARTKNWTTKAHRDGDTWNILDFCPEHPAPGLPPHPDRVPPHDCSLQERCPATRCGPTSGQEVYDWCGHDRLGHQLANALVRQGMLTATDVEKAAPADVLDARQVGVACFERWRTLAGVSAHGA